MNRALQINNRSMFFAAENGQYRYWLKAGVLKLQIGRTILNKFTNSEVGKRLRRYIDMFEIGGGWYEVHAGDTSVFASFGTYTNGLRMWVKALNEFFLSSINANQHKLVAIYTAGKIVPPCPLPSQVAPSKPSNKALEALLARFAH